MLHAHLETRRYKSPAATLGDSDSLESEMLAGPLAQKRVTDRESTLCCSSRSYCLCMRIRGHWQGKPGPLAAQLSHETSGHLTPLCASGNLSLKAEMREVMLGGPSGAKQHLQLRMFTGIIFHPPVCLLCRIHKGQSISCLPLLSEGVPAEWEHHVFSQTPSCGFADSVPVGDYGAAGSVQNSLAGPNSGKHNAHG
ncbi:hypothetical protein KIL84_011474 [Mauremys mutica]|uniref:Uncharacterized protein n=1 Tax=Mauremys mutica TaxID=74926 RepID=A0A9D3XD30_9SAUR|nr:hypothetical protein KIL84_011474 [Mauremys mutica]